MSFLSALFGKKDNKNNQITNNKESVQTVKKNNVSATTPIYHLRGFADANGLFPSELVMLSVAEKYKTTETNYPKYLTYDYEIPNPMKMLKNLQSRELIREGSSIETLSILKLSELKSIASQLGVKGKSKKEDIIEQLSHEGDNVISNIISERAWKLTDAGRSAIRENPYIKFFLEEHSYNVSEAGVTIWTVNEEFIKNQRRLYRDIIFRQLNDQMNKAYLEFTTKPSSGSASTRKYCDCYRIMGLFIEEEGKSFVNAADYYFQYIYKNINVHGGLQLINGYKFKLAIKDTRNTAELYSRYYDEIQLYPFQRNELQRLIDELGISGEEVRENLISSFKRANDKGIMNENEAADFVLFELSGNVDQSRDLAEKLAKKALKSIK